MKRLCVIALCILSGAAHAELKVIADLGGQPAAPYFDGINNQDNAFERQQNARAAVPPEEPATLAAMLPIVTPELTPGTVEPRPLNLPGMQPVFLIGDDPLSRRWLSERQHSLRQLQAVGYVVNISDAAALDELKALAGEVTLLPVSGSDLAKRLALKHYPTLISAEGIEQ